MPLSARLVEKELGLGFIKAIGGIVVQEDTIMVIQIRDGWLVLRGIGSWKWVSR